MLFVRLFDLSLFGFVCYLFLLVSGKGCGLLLWYSLDFFLTFFLDKILLLYLKHIVFLFLQGNMCCGCSTEVHPTTLLAHVPTKVNKKTQELI